MITVTKQMRTETAHRLMGYDGRCSHLHGHSYLWEVTATASDLSDNGMIVDFKDLKRAMMAVIDPLDHALVLHRSDPLLGLGIDPSKLFRATNGKEPRLWIWNQNPTAENMASWAAQAIQEAIDPDNHILITQLRVWETSTSFADWRRRCRS